MPHLHKEILTKEQVDLMKQKLKDNGDLQLEVYALFSLSFFLYLSQIKNLLIKVAIAIIFIIFHIVMLGFFSQGYFVS